MQRLRIKPIVVLAAIGLTIAPTNSGMSQEDYPSQAIRMIVPLPAGGAPDVVTRIIANKLAAKWGQARTSRKPTGLRTEHRRRGGRESRADGYTLLSTAPAPLVTNQFLQSNLNYDARACSFRSRSP